MLFFYCRSLLLALRYVSIFVSAVSGPTLGGQELEAVAFPALIRSEALLDPLEPHGNVHEWMMVGEASIHGEAGFPVYVHVQKRCN
jgi:hypothetical protein